VTRAAIVLGYAAAQLIAKREPRVDVLHGHGPAAAIALARAKAALPDLACVLSVYEGLPALGLEAGLVAELGGGDLDGFGLSPSLTSLGVVSADGVIVNAESTLQTMLESTPLGAALAAKRSTVTGIVNGVDASLWNPLIDSHLSSRFDATYPAGKARCKASLQYMFGLGIQPEVPLIVAIGELSEARGGDLIAQAAEAILRNEVQLLVLGNAGTAAEELTALSAQYPERLALRASHDEKERHLALGGGDFFLLPARKPNAVEIALAGMRYGALPIVRRVGALADVVVDLDAQLETGNGFVIADPTAPEVLAAVQRALAAYARRPAFDDLRKRVMQQDLSWERSARRYEHLYKRIRQSLQKPAA